MNGRFSRLELGSGRAEQSLGSDPVGLVTDGEAVRSAEFHFLAADAALRAGKFEEALQKYTRTLREDRGRLAAWVGQVQMLVELGEHAEARLWSDKALELFRNNGELLAAKARACVRQGDRAAARRCSDAALQAPGSSPARWIARGEVLLDAGEARARDCFEKAIAEPSADWLERVHIARAYVHFGRPASAVEFARLAVGLAPGEAFAWVVQASSYLALGDSARAAESCRRALELAPRSVEARRLLEGSSRNGLARRVRGWIKR